MPAIAESSNAASWTDRVMGPGVSCVCEIGMMPSRLIRPTVGLSPTTPQIDAGDTIDPSVSVPIAMATNPAATAAAEPELDPLVLRSNA